MRGLETDATDKSHVVCKASADKHKWLRVRAMRLSAPCRLQTQVKRFCYRAVVQGPSRCLLVCAPDSVHIQTRAMPPFNTEYDLAQNGYTGGATFFDGIAPELNEAGRTMQHGTAGGAFPIPRKTLSRERESTGAVLRLVRRSEKGGCPKERDNDAFPRTHSYTNMRSGSTRQRRLKGCSSQKPSPHVAPCPKH